MKKQTSKPLVSVCCITYNHEKYIQEAIEGFLTQKTDFPFEIIIHDDASTDGTVRIVKEFADKNPDLIVSIYQKENQYSKNKKPLFDFVFPKVQGKYIALCEGDDYWTDPYKLQRQVDYMEAHPECSMSFHAVQIVENITKTNKLLKAHYSNKMFDQKNLFYSGGYHSPTSSLFFKKKAVDNLPEWVYKAPVGDVPLKLVLSQKGNISYLNEVMSIRRINVAGSWNSRVRGNKNKEYEYHVGMIKMLDGFNEFSGFKYVDEVLEKQFVYSRRILFSYKTIKEKYNFLFKKQYFRKLIKNFSWEKRAQLYFICFFPKIFLLIVGRIKNWLFNLK